MVKAVVLICVARDMMDVVREELSKLDCSTVEFKGSAYEFIAQVEKDSAEEVREVIWKQIRKIKGVQSTLTLMVSSSWVLEDNYHV